MATVGEKIAKEIIAGNGYYSDDPRVMQVVRYRNAWGKHDWAILYEQDVASDRYAASEYVQEPEIVWRADA